MFDINWEGGRIFLMERFSGENEDKEKIPGNFNNSEDHLIKLTTPEIV